MMKENLHKTIWNLTWPNVLSNITVPLLGMVDIAIAGALGGDIAIGAVSVGSSIFNFLYMNCAFLRMGTTGLTAQAYGAKNIREAKNVLFRAISVALIVAFVILLFRHKATILAATIMGGSDNIMSIVIEYTNVRLWALPAALMLFALNGWFVGMQDAQTPFILSIVTNLTNIVASIILTFNFNYGIVGIAGGTVVAQYVSVAMAITIYHLKHRRTESACIDEIFNSSAILKFFSLNGNVLLRSFFITLTYTMFTQISANISDTVLATNTLLMQLFTLYSYIFDGCTFAAESLSGRFYGQQSGHLFRKLCRYLFIWGGLISISYVIIYSLFGDSLLTLFSPSANVMLCVKQNMIYIVIIPLLAYMPFMIDGILFGITHIKPLLLSAICSFTMFFIVQKIAVPIYANDGLWMAFLIFTATRGIVLMPIMRNIYRQPIYKLCH